ncbi:hypothetical protein JCGZ_17817 [Jatropha curcas]|uniref:Uncharacterized protein n=1 Tax=Jatropha curcas TaxID=180498 RepID=A0A067K4E6_JATCU|nr:uncharacterized protein LOC110010592 [Jatropha curcas]KDP26659.1 hypothetical protein JCGZ_17817 [Jatropha curcas]
MLKACRGCLGNNRGSHKESRKKKELGRASLSLDLQLQSKDIFVRIVHAGGREELYQYAVTASHLMEKYPGMCVARPEVFRDAQQSFLWPDENLLPGNKYLIIPFSTARKLRRTQMKKAKFTGNAEGKDETSDVNITWDASRDITDESISSAKEFYTKKGRSPRDSKRPVRRIICSRRPFVPPLPRAKIIRGPGWEPSLTSVQEVSP